MAQPTSSFEQRVNRLMRFRYPLLVGAILNAVFVIGIPLSQPQASNAPVARAPRANRAQHLQPSTESSTERSAAKSHPIASEASAASQHELQRDTGQRMAPRNSALVGAEEDRRDRDAVTESAMNVQIPLPTEREASREYEIARPLANFAHAASMMETWYRNAPKRDPFAGFDSSANDAASASKAAEQQRVSQAESNQEDVTVPDPRRTESFQVLLSNRADFDLAVAFVANDRVYVLEPGATVQLHANRPIAIAFDRGGDFGTQERQLEQGTYVFRVTDRGWTLTAETPVK